MLGFNNLKPFPAIEATASIKDISSKLLLDGEEIEMAFKSKRDNFLFTNKRLLVRDVKGITGKRILFESLPYNKVTSFSYETAGSVDSDVELYIYGPGLRGEFLHLEFCKHEVNIHELGSFLAHRVFSGSESKSETSSGKVEISDSSVSKFADYIFSDHAQIDPKEIQENLQSTNSLVPGEEVELAYRCGRDTLILTTHRSMFIDVVGVSGKRINYKSLKYSTILGYEVETAGSFMDRDATLTWFTNISQDQRRISYDLNKEKVDIMQLLQYMNQKKLGDSTLDSTERVAYGDKEKEKDDSSSSSSSSSSDAEVSKLRSAVEWLAGDLREIDAADANAKFHMDPCILTKKEKVEKAFIGRRDIMLFTNQRVMFIDKQGFSGQRTSYTTFPYSSIKSYQVTTAGSFDADCEFGFFTDVPFDPPPCSGCEEGCADEKPLPGNSYKEFDFNARTTDILSLFRYIEDKTSRIFKSKQEREGHSYIPDGQQAASNGGSLKSIVDYMAGDFTSVDISETQAQLAHDGPCPLLMKDEIVTMGFKHGRDSLIFTNQRILDIDRQGFTGKRTCFTSVPFSSMKTYSVTTSGKFDRDTELYIGLSTPWMPNMMRDLKKGTTDVFAIQKLLAFKSLSSKTVTAVSDLEVPAKDEQSLVAFMTGDHTQIDSNMVQQKLTEDFPILVEDESVLLAFKNGRDMFILTSKRILNVDVKGISGKKVEFQSNPYKILTKFSVRTPGTISRSIKCTTYTTSNISETGLHKKSTDLYEVHKTISENVL